MGDLYELNIEGQNQNIVTDFNHIPTPKSDAIFSKAEKLKKVSNYKCEFDFNTYRDLELRFGNEQPRGGIIFGTPFKLVNHHSSCQQCLYAFEVDTYGRGCTHDCVYCYAKEQLTKHGYWNRPFPMPVDVTDLWQTFYDVFETDKSSKWRSVMEKRTPIRIGSMSDSFMWMDKKYKVTQEFLKLLNHYEYPYIIFTRSDLISKSPYIDLLNPDLCSVQMSIASTNDEMNKLLEPGTPSAKRRLEALKELTRNGFWTTVRLNPFFPMYPDGYFTDPDFPDYKRKLKFDFSSFEMIDEIAAAGVQSVLAGIVRLSPSSIIQIKDACGVDLKQFFSDKVLATRGDKHYSSEEVRAYYERIHARCIQNGIQFTTCYIGNGESQFWNDQDLWSNKKDCCNAIGRVKAFEGQSSRDISWDTRIKHSAYKDIKPIDINRLHEPLNLNHQIINEFTNA
jgi:DNA repair photolyase